MNNKKKKAIIFVQNFFKCFQEHKLVKRNGSDYDFSCLLPVHATLTPVVGVTGKTSTVMPLTLVS